MRLGEKGMNWVIKEAVRQIATNTKIFRRDIVMATLPRNAIKNLWNQGAYLYWDGGRILVLLPSLLFASP